MTESPTAGSEAKEARQRGRPAATTHAEIERVAFRLFFERGFRETTLDDIAAELGIGRRTLARYYASKNDIPWGQFDATLARFHESLAATSPDVPLHEAVHAAVVEFNTFPDAAMPTHRARMTLLLETPELRAHATLRHAAWRHVIAAYVAERLGIDEDDLLPQAVGQVSLGLALAAYSAWLRDDSSDLRDLLDTAMHALRVYLQV